jgi:hypothetical protein
LGGEAFQGKGLELGTHGSTFVSGSNSTYGGSEPYGDGVRAGDYLDDGDPAKAGPGPTDEELARVLEHDKNLSIAELVEDTYEDVLDREELRAETGLSDPLEQVPDGIMRLEGRRVSEEVTYNFARQIARRELKRFGGRLQEWFDRRRASEVVQLNAIMKAHQKKYYRLLMIQAVLLIVVVLAHRV